MNRPNPLPPGLREILRCPVTGARLRWLTPAEWAVVLRAQGRGTLRALTAGAPLEPCAHALVCEDGKICYPVRDGVPYLVREAGFWLPEPPA